MPHCGLNFFTLGIWQEIDSLVWSRLYWIEESRKQVSVQVVDSVKSP